MEQNRLVPLNWVAGAKFLQYSHFSTEKKRVFGGKKQVISVIIILLVFLSDHVVLCSFFILKFWLSWHLKQWRLPIPNINQTYVVLFSDNNNNLYWLTIINYKFGKLLHPLKSLTRGGSTAWLCTLPVAVVTISAWLVSALSCGESSAVESFTAPHTCQSDDKGPKKKKNTRLRHISNKMKWKTASCELTGNGSAPSWMTKPSMRCVRTLGLTTAWGGGALSPCEIPRDPESTAGDGDETLSGAPGFYGGRKGRKWF